MPSYIAICAYLLLFRLGHIHELLGRDAYLSNAGSLSSLFHIVLVLYCCCVMGALFSLGCSALGELGPKHGTPAAGPYGYFCTAAGLGLVVDW